MKARSPPHGWRRLETPSIDGTAHPVIVRIKPGKRQQQMWGGQPAWARAIAT